MVKNMGGMDRVIRFILGLAVLIVSFLITGLALQIVLWVVAAILLITSYVGTCPAYMPFHFSTKKK